MSTAFSQARKDADKFAAQKSHIQDQLADLEKFHKSVAQYSPEGFANVFFPHWLRYKTPPFHEELYDLCLLNRVTVRAPRYFGKSVIFSRIYPLWAASYGFKRDILIVSATEAIAVEQLAFIRRELENNELMRAYLGLQTTDNWRQDEINLRNGSRIRAKGQGFQLRGLHPDSIICDDLESEHAQSQEQRKKLEFWFYTTLLGSIGLHDQLIVVGTVLHPQSLLRSVEKQPDWTHRTYRGLTNGVSIWPEHRSTADLLKMKSVNALAFEQEIQNNPLRTGETVFRPEWLGLRTPVPPPKTELVYTAVDPAISKKEGSSCTAIVTLGVQQDRIFVLEAKQGRWSFKEQLEEIQATYQTWAPMMIGIEEVAYQKVLSEVLARVSSWMPIHPMKADKDKRRRAMGITHLLQKGLVYLQGQELVEQLEIFTGTPQDESNDLVDAFVYALHLVQQYCYPKEPSTEKVEVLTANEKSVWDDLHRKQKEARGMNFGYDQHLGSEW